LAEFQNELRRFDQSYSPAIQGGTISRLGQAVEKLKYLKCSALDKLYFRLADISFQKFSRA